MKRVFLLINLFFLLLLVTACDKSDDLKGNWSAKKEDQIKMMLNNKGDTFGGNEDYLLECDGKGNYTLTLEEGKKENGTYQINEDKSVIFQTSDKLIKEKCTLISNNELACEYYSSKYVKNDK